MAHAGGALRHNVGDVQGYRVRVWLEDRLTQDELRWDIHGAINRALELQLERPLETIIQ